MMETSPIFSTSDSSPQSKKKEVEAYHPASKRNETNLGETIAAGIFPEVKIRYPSPSH